MKITELLKPESIALGVKASSKDEIIDCLTGLMEQGGRLNDRAGYKEGIYSEYARDVVRPSAQECAQNGRARSTKMRWAVKAE